MTDKDFFNEGMHLCYNENKFEESIKSFNKSIQLNPLFMDAYFYKAMALDKLNKYEEAIRIFDEVIELNPKFSAAHNNKGCSSLSIFLYDEAVKCFEKGLELNPNNKDIQYNLNLGKLYKNGCFKANFLHNDYFKRKMLNIEISVLGKTEQEQKDYCETLAFYFKALKMREDSPEILFDKDQKNKSPEFIEACQLFRELERLSKVEEDENQSNSHVVQRRNQFLSNKKKNRAIIKNKIFNEDTGTIKLNDNCLSIDNDYYEKLKKNREMSINEVIDFIMEDNVDNKPNKISKKKNKNKKNYDKTISQNANEKEILINNNIFNHPKEEINNFEHNKENSNKNNILVELFYDDIVEKLKDSLYQNCQPAMYCNKIKPTFTDGWIENLNNI